MLVPRRLTIRGFRGYRSETAFDFHQPATIFFGENHSGKSSTLNAIEWCLFGEDCLGKQTGIRERIGWIVPNHHDAAPEAVVELELANSAGTHVIRRRVAKNGKRPAQELHVCRPDGAWISGVDAEQHLAQLRQGEFRDFLTTVYQHQEAIRAVLTQEPKERNDAIDRLLGLAVYRNLLDALDRAKTTDRHKSLRQKFEQFEGRLQTALATREHDLEAMRFEAAQAGILDTQQSAAGGLAAAQSVARQLEEFAQEAGLTALPLPLPAEWTGLSGFETAARKRIAAFRGELPAVRQQHDLFQKQTSLLHWKAKWETTLESGDSVGRTVRELDKQHGSQQTVTHELIRIDETITAEQERLRSANRQAALVREVIGFLEANGPSASADSCPVCRQSAPGLLPALRAEWENGLRQEVQTMSTALEQLQLRKKLLAKVAERYAGLNRLLEQAIEERSRLRQEAAILLAIPIQDTDDPLALVDRHLADIQGRVQAIQSAIAEKVARLADIERELDSVRRIREILLREEKSRFLDQMQATPEYLELERLRDRAACWLDDVAAIQGAIGITAQEEAHSKLAAAEEIIDGYFRQLSRHPAIQRIRLQVSEVRQRNHYSITDGEGQDLTPILSQGDLNALALAIFLGLASAAGAGTSFGFVMLDDPSQSLGSEHKKALVDILDVVGREKHIVVATMDAEFRELLVKGLTRNKQEYVFGNWSVETGPVLMPW
jgi:DNA repair protein SbcC/Rad50